MLRNHRTYRRGGTAVRAPLIALAAGLVPAAGAHAQHGGDVFLELVSQRITTGLIDPDSEEITPDVRVFTSTLGEFAANKSDEPGFDSFTGTFPAGSAIGFTIRKALREFDPGLPGFAAIPDERMKLSFSTLNRTTPTDDTPVTGFTINVASDGSWHKHYVFELLAPAEEGVYLLELELWSTNGGVLTSRPFWIVFGQDADDDEIEHAERYCRRFLWLCPADYNEDKVVDAFDYDDFVSAFFGDLANGTTLADFNLDGVTDAFDYDDFVSAFFTPCEYE